MTSIDNFITDSSDYKESGSLNKKPAIQGKNEQQGKNETVKSKGKKKSKKPTKNKKEKTKKKKSNKKYVMSPNNKMNNSCSSYSLINTNGSMAPIIDFKVRVKDKRVSGDNKFKWSTVNTKELYDNRRIVIFAIPGAFTPICSNTHLPGYEKKYHQVKKLGIDEVYCLSVNDPFVMFQWCKNLKIKNIKPIPDGNGEFTKKMGALVNKKNLGFGKRSWRYSMVVNNGIIEKIFAEKGKQNNCPADPFEVSDVDTMLKYLKSI